MTSRILIASFLLAASCAGERRFPLREPMWRDTDLDSRKATCRADDDGKRVCRPDEYVSSISWDAADNVAFRPVSRFFAVDPGGEARNVNSMDEVPDSSWFQNRIGRHPMTAAEVGEGACGELELDAASAADGTWLIDQGKMNGANPGFRVKLPDGRKYLLKSDSSQGERTTAATVVGTRLYHAAGWYVPCEQVVYVRKAQLKIKPGLSVTDNFGVVRPFDEAALDKLLASAQHRGDSYRFSASSWLAGRLIGPFTYDGVKEDDPGDVIPHEDRRDLRGARLLAAWTDHFDSREQNSMAAWIADDPKDPDSSPGFVRHYYLDLGDCFGSEWADEIWRRIGHAYYFDVGYVLEDLFSFGAVDRPWDHAVKDPRGTFGYFSARGFDAELWRGGYPNPAFGRMTEHDGAWAARIIARFTDEDVRAAVQAGDLTEPENERFLYEQLVGRRDAILRRYLAKLSPVTDVAAEGRDVCGLDLARRSGLFQTFRYDARLEDGGPLATRVLADGHVCATIPADTADAAGRPRYRVVDLTNGQAKGVLHVHLYDFGAKGGLRIAGVERDGG